MEEQPQSPLIDKSLENERNLLAHKRNLLAHERNLLAHERTRLASERTLLSWIRTGLTGIGIGMAVGRLLAFQSEENRLIAKTLGQLLIVWGIIIFLFALVSYRHSYHRLEIRASYKSSLIGVIFIISALVILSVILFWIMA